MPDNTLPSLEPIMLGTKLWTVIHEYKHGVDAYTFTSEKAAQEQILLRIEDFIDEIPEEDRAEITAMVDEIQADVREGLEDLEGSGAYHTLLERWNDLTNETFEVHGDELRDHTRFVRRRRIEMKENG